MKTYIGLVVFLLVSAAMLPYTVFGQCCLAPDNGSGTVDFPADCAYNHPFVPMMIVDGLPAGSTLELRGPLTDFYNVVNSAGGTLGGERCTFDAYIDWTVTGTGDLAGFNRHLSVPVSGEIHIGPRTPGDPVQSFPAKIYALQGELFGDPDFCMLRVRAGETEGLPSPGHTILTQYPDDKFNVESFFDITYEIEFEGCPGSMLEDYMGTTEGLAPRTTCFDTTYTADWCRLQWPLVIAEWSGQEVTVYGRLYIAGLTDQSTGNDPVPAVVRGQVGYGPEASEPSGGGWTWFEAFPNPAWNGGAVGEPNNDEYMATLVTPASAGTYDYACRFSGDAGATWLYGDKDTGIPGEDGSQNGYQTANAGKMTVRFVCCSAPDNGSGTVNLPPECPYDHPAEPMVIKDGLPVGTTLELTGPLTDFYNVVNTPGGSLGGERCTFDAYIDWTVTGTGDLYGFTRHLYMPVSGEIHIAPRTPGDSVQTFSCVLYDLTGELFGDPDFCTLRFTAGEDNDLPGPGLTILTELPSGDFAVDSFFDITYTIEFEGCPGSMLDGYAGTTLDAVPRTTCYGATYPIDWCRLQWPLDIDTWPAEDVTVYGRLYIAGVTDRTTGNDIIPGIVRGQAGYGPRGSDPASDPLAWTWFDAVPNPGWDGGVAGEPNNDEFMATLTSPPVGGEYDFCYRFSGDVGISWLYGDRDTGIPGEDGSENGYQPANAGKMTVRVVCCSAPDNGSGTIDFPPDCPYDSETEPMMIVDGLPPETTIEMWGPITDFTNVVNTPGGSLGGERCTFDAYMDWTVTGTGDLYGLIRHLYVPVSGEIHIAPRTPGDSIQTFDCVVYDLAGELFGDPDFCTLRFTAGENNGLPGPGRAVLTELPGGDFAVDSFFDITYQIEFEGCPGSPLDGYMGTTTDAVRRMTCYAYAGVDDRPDLPRGPEGLRLAPVAPNPFRGTTMIGYAVPDVAGRPHVTLKIYDAAGRLVRTVMDDDKPGGYYTASWDGRDSQGGVVAPGIYFLRLSLGKASVTQRMVLLR
jgi:hypothetical protein